MSEFKDIIDKEDLINTKTNLLKIKMILEKKLEDKLEELVQLKQELPHLVHLDRISKIEKQKRENNE